jgi:hypothetical protein
MLSKIKSFVSVSIYVTNSTYKFLEESLEKLLNIIEQTFERYEIILVHDSISDFPAHIIDILKQKQFKHIILLDLAYYHGTERAMTAAADLSVGDFLIEVDYPLSNFSEDSFHTLFTKATESGIDILGAIPRNSKKISSTLFYLLVRKLQITPDILKTEALRIISRRVLNHVLRERNSFRYRKISYALSGFKYQSIEFYDLIIENYQTRKHRTSLASDIITGFSRIGSTTSRILTALFASFSLGIGLYSIIIRLIGLPVSEGWTTIMIFLSIGFSGLFTVLNIISRTVEITLREIQHTSPYTVQEVVRLDNK